MAGENFKTLKVLSGIAFAADEFAGVPVGRVAVEPRPSFHQFIELRSRGLTLYRRHGNEKIAVQIPLEVLLKLAGDIEPKFNSSLNEVAPLKKVFGD